MGKEQILRPMRLLQRFPAARRMLTELSRHFRPDGAISQEGWRYFEAQQGHFAGWLNGNLKAMSKDDRPKWHHQLYDCFNEVARVAAFRKYGQQTFMLGSDIVVELSKTSLGDIRLADLHLPYPCCYLALQEPVAFGIDGAVLEGAYLRNAPAGIDVTLCTRELGTSRPDWAIDPQFSVELSDLDGEGLLADAVTLQVQRCFERASMLRSGLERKAIELQPSVEVQLGVLVSTSEDRLARLMEEKQQEISAAIALVANAACLLAAMPEEMVRAKVLIPPRTKSKRGTTHQVPGALEVRYLSFGSGGGDGNNASNAPTTGPRAHWRRGHWRRQAYGAERNVFRPKWIRPVLVNPQNGSPAERTEYRVEG